MMCTYCNDTQNVVIYAKTHKPIFNFFRKVAPELVTRVVPVLDTQVVLDTKVVPLLDTHLVLLDSPLVVLGSPAVPASPVVPDRVQVSVPQQAGSTWPPTSPVSTPKLDTTTSTTNLLGKL